MNKFLFSLIVGLGLFFQSSVQAATLYSQTTPEEPSAAFSSSEFSTVSQKIADNFSFNGTEDSVVRSVRVIGATGLIDPVTDDFRVTFFDDVGGLPGNVLAGGDFNVGSAFSRNPTGGQLLNGVVVPFEYEINLTGEVTLMPNTTYWISITNTPSQNAGWVWARANGMFDSKIASTMNSVTAGNWVEGSSSGGMWFELNSHIIPEPSTLTLAFSISLLSYRINNS